MNIKSLPPTLPSLMILAGDTNTAKLQIELCPSAPNPDRPGLGWRERAKKGTVAMYYRAQGAACIGDQIVRTTVFIDAVDAEGNLKELGIEPNGTYVDKATGEVKPLLKRGISQFQSPDNAKFHLDEAGQVVFDESEILGPDGKPFPLAYGISYLVYKANGKTLRLIGPRFTYTEGFTSDVDAETGEAVKIPTIFALARCAGVEVVDAPRPSATGAAVNLADLGKAPAPKQVVTRESKPAAAPAAPKGLELTL